jgi:hypothetical protein
MARPKARGSVRVSALVSLVLSCTVIGVTLAESTGKTRIDYVAKLNELITRGQDESLNAEPFYRRAFGLCVALPNSLSAIKVLCWPTDLNAEERVAMRDWIHVNSEALAQLQLGSRRPGYWFQYQGLSTWDIDQAGYIRRTREVFYPLMWRAKMKAAEGDVKGAIEDVLLCYRFGADTRKRPLLGEQLSGRLVLEGTFTTAFQVLDKVKVDGALLQFFQQQMERRAQDQDFLVDLQGDELATLDSIQWVVNGIGTVAKSKAERDEILSKAWDFWGEYIPPAQMDSVTYNRSQEELERLARKGYVYYRSIMSKTPLEWERERVDWYKAKKEFVGRNLLLFTLVPAVPHMAEAGFRLRARRDALITTLGLLRYENDKSVFPDDLDVLVSAGYVRQLPMDPYSDKPLIYKRMDQGFTLYSVGPDFEDDGGRHNTWGRNGQPGDQVFWPVQ